MMTRREESLKEQNNSQQDRIKELEETLRAIQMGEVDAIIVESQKGEQVFSLSSAETTYRLLIEQMSEGVAIVTAGGVTLYCNEAFARIVNKPLESLAGEYLGDFLDSSYRKKFHTLVTEGSSRIVRQEFVFAAADKKGSDTPGRSFLFVAAPFAAGFADGGNLDAETGNVSLIAYEVTELRRLEKELLDHKKNLEKKVRDRTREVKMSNQQLRAANQQLSANEQQLRAANQELIDNAEELKKLEAESRQYAAELEKSERAALNVMEDALEKSNQLRKSEEFSRSIIESSLDCIKILDLEGNLKFISNGGQELLEIEDIESFLNKSWIDFWEGEDNQKARKAVELAREGEFGFFEGFCPTNKGTPKWWSVKVSPVRDPEGKVLELLSVSRDITEQKELEERYVKSQKMEAVGRLAGGVAHDLNNTLSVVMGYSEMALERIAEGDPLRDDLLEVFNASRRSTSTIAQLLAFASRQTIAPEILDLNETIENMLRMLRSLIGEDIDLVWTPAKSLWQVKMDPSQIDQILANMMVNSRDAISDVGRVVISTESVSLDEEFCREHPDLVPGDFALLSISDDGCGMGSDTLAQVFEPYFTTKAVGEGSGLGLATVFGIVKQNSGHIEACSEPGQGTTFRIYLPKHEGEITESLDKSEREIPKGRGESVLIVEDEEQILKLSQRILGNLGYKVLAASNPKEAVELARNYGDKLDLLITDVVMPQMNGRELADQIMPDFPELRLLFMSGYTADVIADRGVLGEGIRFLQKPFTSRDLAIQVRAALDE